ncbi:MAG: 3-hydroxyacyl-CoA dehydrogenase NAD-binding domain-containing protein [Candidatus Korobacteraceae bacterium]
MRKHIRKVTVLGAGTMGARIAAHLANGGVPSFLLDIVPPDANGGVRNSVAAAALEALRKSKPAAFFEPGLARLITPGNFEDDLKVVAESDWIIEAVVEDLEIKRALLKKVETLRRPGTPITTNTSGLPVTSIAEGFSEDFRRSWFGTHFFNPPRYMRLLEIIPTPDSDKELVSAVADFCDLRLGKGVVRAKDTPNFIANRIGVFSVMNVMRLMQQMDFSVEEADALSGTVIGWPKSATFRTMDMVGLDVLGHVVRNAERNIHDERSDLRLPEFFQKMLERKWLGDKTGSGFYKKVKGAPEGQDRMVLDWKTLDYRPRQKVRFASMEMARTVEDIGERLRMLLGFTGQKPDRAGQFLWEVLADLWTYSANRIGEICDSLDQIDRAMRLGFNWDLGPFELWDAVGVERTVERMTAEGRPVSPKAQALLASGSKAWYQPDATANSGRKYFNPDIKSYVQIEAPQGVWSVHVAKLSGGVVKKNSGASLVDLGDGVGCVEFHTKMNAIGGDIMQLVTETLKPGSTIGTNFDAFVISNDAQHFSAGANIMLLLLSIQEEEWDDVDLMIRGFQTMTQAIKFSSKPVVAAPFGMTLGGGCEVSLHAAARHPHAELYMGLVEVGVGLLPAGGGCKEMTLRAVDTASAIRPDGRGESVELMEGMKKAFETIAMGKVSTSAAEARNLGFLDERDHITMNRERVLADAKAHALELARGYRPPTPRMDIPAPGESILATLKLEIHLMRQGEFISEHEVQIGNKVAEVLCGGNVSPGTPVSEQYLLDLEREAFLSLCGEKKTQERIQYTLKTGKTLRN